MHTGRHHHRARLDRPSQQEFLFQPKRSSSLNRLRVIHRRCHNQVGTFTEKQLVPASAHQTGGLVGQTLIWGQELTNVGHST